MSSKQEDTITLGALHDAVIVGHSWIGELVSVQLKLKDGRYVTLKANGETHDKRFSVAAWLEIWTCFPEKEKKLLLKVGE
jgi:hypothetical protein